ncbi:thymidine phosphorylase [Paracoccus denitrificans]|jgi:thymidine phosphorylase|uniref:Thymidine phosphorylase n=1 Tax=Paracoccus denitrificans (strain Pd 1222) TaxID=318586 RepID=A1B470_PARDP|nr:thymidine phosphorylase [Paracoccus denitrificans]ABL70314.1 thymidine phosphorylase [Paracoccus denitrificans PD1222]MBB4627223.1 thymidine phosphorylase [Paracoccus denitrificans]MCU7428004.1 thymidine phosphorylase [Paracoccus denitrificans]QAR25664.1 thymidine phosphorylase [Paracoccus denitrificans]UPV94562.1 thymidine phosphorylase [Paracoccus denitrificans]
MSPAGPGHDPRPVIAAVRDGRGLDAAGAALVARGLADGSVSDAQAAAFAMAVLTRGLDEAGRVALTRAMRDSGHVLRWDLPGPVVDKHSTGGIGDAVSLILAPLVASCGAYVPMISGRGLGHTGGTLDKLEAIPGFRTALSEDDFRRVVAEVGCAIVAAGPELAPADARLYAIRDESATVGSIDLITASILSKKLAAGLDALVLDVKQGSGAFLRSPDAALALARALVDTAKGAGCRTRAYVTDMDQPLARAAGNALELREAIAVLTGEQGALRDLSLALSSACLDLGGLADGALRALDGGAAAERFARMVVAQGGPADLLEHPERHLPPAPVVRAVPGHGRVVAIDTEVLGHAVVALGGGRLHAGDRIDPRVGLAELLRIGEEAGPGRPLALVHAASDAAADAAVATVAAAYLLGDGPEPGPLIRSEVT